MTPTPSAAQHTMPVPAGQDRRGRRIGALALATCTVLVAGGFAAAPAVAAPVSIADVQGTGDTSPMVDATVTVEGVVIGDYRTGGYRGIAIQTASSGGDVDATPGASDGLFVHLGGVQPELAIGDLVSVTGTVSEYYGQTQIGVSSVVDITVVTAGAGVPAVTPLPDSVVGEAREAFENMLVAPEGTYRVASSHQLYNYGTVWLNPGELNVKSTEQTRPGDDANAIAVQNRAERILLDDGWNSKVTSDAHPAEQPYFRTDEVVRNGDSVSFSEHGYVLQYGFDDWRLQPVMPIDDTTDAAYSATFSADNPRPTAVPEVGGDAQIAAFNVYNYFTTLRSEHSEARGADTAEEFATQRSKIISAISALDAEIVALMEIENSIHFGDPIDTAVADLVAGLNDAAGSQVWAYADTPAVLDDASITDPITNAIIYRTDAVEAIGASMAPIDETVWGNAREPIAQAFDIDGRTVSVIANHFKSKSAPDEGGTEPADGQGFFNADRVAQAESLLSFTQDVAESAGSDDIVLLGDFNAYSKEDPMQVFADAGWTDLVSAQAAGEYTYTYDGELGSLDHAIASPSLVESVTGTGVWTINAPEWSDRGYAFGAAEAGTPYRSSDHDPVLLGISSDLPAVSIDIVTINDFHGRIEANGDDAAGAAVLAGAVQQVREANPNTVFAAAGDLIGASTFTSFILDDNPTIDALNAAGLDVSAAGNHEFDQGWEDLRDRVQDRAKWEYISSNVFLTETGEPALAPAWVTELDGVSVGFIGAVTEELDSLVNPEGIEGLEVRSIVDSVNDVAADLTDGEAGNGEADVIVLLVHEGASTDALEGLAPDTPLGEIVAGVDDSVNAIVSAHTHMVYNHVVDGRPVVSAGEFGQNFGLMNVQVDPKTKELISISNEVKPLVDEAGTALYPAVQEVGDIVAAATEEADVLGAVPAGEIASDLNRARQSDGSENRGGESTIGNFVADVHLWATDADIAFMNPGGLRANLTYASAGAEDPDGNVTFREAAEVQPFANTLVTLELTGAQVKAVLEEQWQPAEASRPFLKLGVSENLQYTYDPTAAAGERITSVMLDGEPIDPEASYVVVANSFLAGGGDNFATLGEGANHADTGKIDLASTVEWFSEHSVATPDLAQRAVGVVVEGAGAAAGEEVALELSSLAFTGGEAAPGEVTVSLGDTELATAEIDPSPVDTTDEAGRASVSFTVPAGVSGAQELTVAVEATGTSITVPITFAEAPVAEGTISLSADEVRQGGELTVTGEGFPAGAELVLELRSDPVTLGEITADADGAFRATVTIPAETPVGAHTLAAIQPDGAEATAALQVTAAGQGGDLPSTGGADMTPWLLLSALLLLLGAALVVVRRIRAPKEQ